MTATKLIWPRLPLSKLLTARILRRHGRELDRIFAPNFVWLMNILSEPSGTEVGQT